MWKINGSSLLYIGCDFLSVNIPHNVLVSAGNDLNQKILKSRLKSLHVAYVWLKLFLNDFDFSLMYRFLDVQLVLEIFEM